MAAHVELSRGTFVALWWLLLLLHVGFGAFLLSSARLLWYLDDPVFLYLVAYVVPSNEWNFTLYGALWCVLGAVHVLRALQMMVFSIFAMQLTLTKGPIMTNTFKRRHPRLRAMALAPTHNQAWSDAITARHLHHQATLRAAASKGWFHLTAVDGFFGISSRHFDAILAVHEITEAAAQAYQAYRCSTLVSNRGINRAFVAAVVLNCWSTPLIRAWFAWGRGPRQPQRLLVERALIVVTDVALNAVTSTILPLVVFMPYYMKFDLTIMTFGVEVLYGIREFPAFVSESQLVFPASKLDYTTKIVAHIGIVLALLRLERLVARRSPAVLPVPVESLGVPSDQHWFFPARREDPSRVLSRQSESPPRRSKVNAVTNVILTIGGSVILGFHLHATHREFSTSDLSCALPIQPWFAEGIPCAVFIYNCVEQRTLSVPPEQLLALDPTSLLSLVFVRCPMLVVPSDIQRFPNLINAAIVDCTLVDWGVDAAFSITLQPRVAFLEFVLVNLTGIPPALLQPLPPMLMDIEFSHTNLTTLPSDLHLHWQVMPTLYFEHCQFQEVPETLTRMQVYDLSLLGNNISNVTLLTEMQPVLTFLSLNENPVRELPATIQPSMSLALLALESMQLTALPQWVQTQVQWMAALYGNPYCHEHPHDDLTIKCIERDPRTGGKLPFELVLTEASQ